MDPGTSVTVRTYSRWGETHHKATVIAMIPAGVSILDVLPRDRAYPRGVALLSVRDRILVVTEYNEIKVPLVGMVKRAS
jgi:hypothetical protein